MLQSSTEYSLNILQKLAHFFGTEIKNRTLEIPENFGEGYCKGYVFNEHLRMLIMNYELRQSLFVKNPEINVSMKIILFKFQNIFPKNKAVPLEKQSKETPSVLITTSSVNTDVIIPIQTNRSTINIEVHADYLNRLFESAEKSAVLQSLLQNTQPLLFDLIIIPSLQKVVDEIVNESVEETFKLFFLRVKAEELICRLLIELAKRDEKHLYSLNIHDIHVIYKVKEQILEHLETPPVINELAVFANMSPTKLKRLFKQIFGKSIFNYYQKFRMEEAAVLLKAGNLSVSEVGNQLGFINISHFARIFKEHIGSNPKQYSKSDLKSVQIVP
ncbi:AraC family transcriptional regulator [Flavobacterium pectinovorum]|uniref:helix-turn-helix transcriptional regulator n=1 Tax=Flavobacterium pectinovorum TaxID=29533 RepID=UPI00265FE7C8|nr:AraC family transcriptional regulator [Flavobacterium pectinovorum]WKL49596.1 AraC family transcriptional regulator [Flavobacterium pectinovorum]